MSEPDCTDVCERVDSTLRKMGFKISEESDHTDILEALDKVEFIKIEEADIMGLLLRRGDLLTCFNCGKKLSEIYSNMTSKRASKRVNDRFVAKLILEPGEVNYPREPDIPASLYFVCAECEEKT
jgi:hypothetical protein